MNRDSERIYDEFLVAATLDGDPQARARLIARWQPRFLRHAWRVLGDTHGAQDAVQEAWMDILRGLPLLDDVVAFPAWAYRILTRRCQRQFRRIALEPIEAATEEAPGNVGLVESAAGERAAELAIVMRAIDTLPAAQRAALALFYLEDLSVAEIAIATDVAPGTVKTRLMHARNRIRAILEGDGHEQTR